MYFLFVQVVAHYIPFRAIRAGEQLSDSKGASAALSSEVAVMSVHRSIRGFVGPADIFRNPEAIFRKFKPTTPKMTAEGNSPFRLVSAMCKCCMCASCRCVSDFENSSHVLVCCCRFLPFFALRC